MYSLPSRYNFLDNELIRVDKSVSVYLEVAREIKKAYGNPILFENVVLKDGSVSKYPIVANIVGRRDTLARYLGCSVEDIKRVLLDAYVNRKSPKIIGCDEYNVYEPNLYSLPILFHYPGEAGYYITSGIIIAEDPEYGINASYHRLLVIDRDKVVARILPRHLHKYIERGVRRVAICIGNTPEVLVASGMSPELGVSELDIANAIKEIRLVDFDGIIGSEAEIVLVGEVTDDWHDEGPFVDVTGTYDIVRKQRVIRIDKMYIRDNAFYHALLPADSEHKLLMGLPREPFIYKGIRDAGVDCIDVFLTPGGASWLHCVIKIKKNGVDDPKIAIETAFKVHKSLKRVIVVDEDINIYDPYDVEWAIATRVQPDRDLYLYPREKGSSLDPSADQVTRETTKWGIDATIPDPSRKGDFMKVV
jgi:UbiD family decarboxylase